MQKVSTRYGGAGALEADVGEQSSGEPRQTGGGIELAQQSKLSFGAVGKPCRDIERQRNTVALSN
jgi:hypothetical protein